MKSIQGINAETTAFVLPSQTGGLVNSLQVFQKAGNVCDIMIEYGNQEMMWACGYLEERKREEGREGENSA
jgi:hypothetical protein